MAKKRRVLVVSTLYPNPEEPHFGIFVHRKVAHIAEQCEVRVIAPVPWFPLGSMLRRYAHRRRIPRATERDGVHIEYPRFVSIPRVLKPLDGIFLFLRLWMIARRDPKGFDVIDAQLAFPDGFAVWLLSRTLKVPCTFTLRGHDINHTPRFPVRRKQIRAALKGASGVVAVAEALRKEAIALGCPPQKIETIPNGVDRRRFFIKDRSEARARVGIPSQGRMLLSVGHLVPRKGHHLVIEALALLLEQGWRDLRCVIVGAPSEEGDARSLVEETARRWNVTDRVHLAGARPNDELVDWYNAADLLVLASEKEGRPNVVLEALACGIPVVASAVWGVPELLTSSNYGLLVERDPIQLAEGIGRALIQPWHRETISRYAHEFRWDLVAERVVTHYQRIADPAGALRGAA